MVGIVRAYVGGHVVNMMPATVASLTAYGLHILNKVGELRKVINRIF